MKYASEFEYAQRNGCLDTYVEYVERRYLGYCEICERCGIKPASREELAATQP